MNNEQVMADLLSKTINLQKALEKVYDSNHPWMKGEFVSYVCCAMDAVGALEGVLGDKLLAAAIERAMIDFIRVSGLCVCKECGKLYFDHPSHEDFSWLRVLCDGTLVKL